MLDVTNELYTSGDSNIKKSSLELLINSLNKSSYTPLNNKIKSHVIDMHLNLSNMYLDTNLSKSIEILSDGLLFAHKEKVDDTKILFPLAKANHLAGMLDDAKEAYSTLVLSEKADKYTRFYSNIGLAKICLEEEDYDLFKEHFSQASKESVSPGVNQNMQEYLAGLYNITFNPDKSIDSFKKIIGTPFGKFSESSLANLGIVYAMAYGEQSVNLAKVYLQKASKSSIPEVKVYSLYNLGILEHNEGYIEKSKKIARDYGMIEGDIFEDLASDPHYKRLYK